MKNLKDLKLDNQRVLLRADLNAPLKADNNGQMQITDDGRLRASVSTITELINRGCKIVILAHLGRPKGERKPELSLRPICKRLSELLNKDIKFIDQIDDKTKDLVNGLKSGEVAMIENIRFEKGSGKEGYQCRWQANTARVCKANLMGRLAFFIKV